MATAEKVNADAAAPTHAKFPPVSSLHKIVPVSPSGWVRKTLKITSGAMKVAKRMSATARFTSRKFMGTLKK